MNKILFQKLREKQNLIEKERVHMEETQATDKHLMVKRSKRIRIVVAWDLDNITKDSLASKYQKTIKIR